MKGMAILGLLLSLSILGATLYVTKEFESWKQPYNIAYYLADNLSSSFSQEGLFYPANDLQDPLLDARKIVIANGMNEHTIKEVVRKLLYLDSLNQQPIDLYISSQGGWYDAVFTIIDTFHAIGSPVNTRCIGGCYSASMVLVASGTGTRYALPNAHFSVHIDYGNFDSEPYGEPPDRVNTFYKNFSDIPQDWLPLENDRYYYFSAQQALEFKLIDHIIDTQKTIQ